MRIGTTMLGARAGARTSTLRALLLSLLTLFVFACESEVPDKDLTGVLVVIDAEDAVRDAAASLHVLVEVDDAKAPGGKAVRLDEKRKPISFPKQVALIPKGGDASRIFTLTATALDERGRFVSQARIITGYVAGELRSTTLLIEGNDCLRKECDDTDTCQIGRCTSAEVDPQALNRGLDASIEQEDPDAGGDAELDAGGDADAEAGTDAQGGDSDVDECALGTDNCDHVPNACVNSDAGFRCTCPDGYTGDGKGTEGCNDKNECGSGPSGAQAACSAGATDCKDLAGSYECTCKAGYSGTGGKTCTDINECAGGAVAACGAGATDCMNMPGSYSCTCPSGYTGNATTACVAVGSEMCMPSATAVCGAGATACSKSGSVNSCTCAAGCTGSGTSACVDPDECAAGVTATCGAFATGCTNGGCGYSCACNPAYALNTDRHGCRARAWGTAAYLESDTVSAMVPAVAVDNAGNAIAVWFQGAFGARSVYAARYTFAGSWSAPALLETGSGDCGGPNDAMWGPQIAMNTAGVAFAAWEQSDGTRTNIWAARYSGTAWGTATLIESDNAGYARLPYVTVDGTGNAIVVWFQNDGTRERVWANRYSGTSWGTAAIISTNTLGNADNARVAGDSNGNAMAAWEQTDGASPGISNIWAARYTPSGGWAAAVLIETTNTGNAWNPAIAADSAGNATAVWYQQDAGMMRPSIWANRFNGSSWGTATLIEQSDNGAASSTVAMDNAGNAIAAWYQYDGEWDSIYANRYSGGSWGTPQRIETQNVGNARTPMVAMDSVGNAVIVWYQWDGTHADIWANRYIGSGWASPSGTLLEGDDSSVAWLPAVAVSSSGSAVAVWTRFDATPVNGSETPNISGARGDIVANRLE